MQRDRLTYWFGAAYELGKTFIIVLVVFAITHFFIASLVRISGPSMEPTVASGQIGIIVKALYYNQAPARGDIVALRFPGDPYKVQYVKRVVGLPGESITIGSDGRVKINNQPLTESYARFMPATGQAERTWQLDADDYFVLGDNRAASSDSRSFDPVDRRFITGPLKLIIWPPTNATAIPATLY